MRFARPLRDRGGEEAEVCNRARNIEAACELHGLAGVAGFELGQCVEIKLDKIGEAVEKAGAFLGRRRRPAGCRATSRGDRGIDIRACRIGAPCENLARRGLENIEIAAVEWRLQVAVDQIGELERLRHEQSLAALRDEVAVRQCC